MHLPEKTSPSPTGCPCDFGEEAPFDPQAPLLGGDWLEYESFADLLAGRPFGSFRNEQIALLKVEGATPEEVAAWIAAYDGLDLILCDNRSASDRSKRAVRAYTALDRVEHTNPPRVRPTPPNRWF